LVSNGQHTVFWLIAGVLLFFRKTSLPKLNFSFVYLLNIRFYCSYLRITFYCVPNASISYSSRSWPYKWLLKYTIISNHLLIITNVPFWSVYFYWDAFYGCRIITFLSTSAFILFPHYFLPGWSPANLRTVKNMDLAFFCFYQSGDYLIRPNAMPQSLLIIISYFIVFFLLYSHQKKMYFFYIQQDFWHCFLFYSIRL